MKAHFNLGLVTMRIARMSQTVDDDVILALRLIFALAYAADLLGLFL